MKKNPNLVIVGTVKGGTTSLFRYLAMHPDICASKKKETCYFLPLRYGGELSPWGKYEQLFDHYSDQQYVMEATPGYFDGGMNLAKGLQQYLGEDIRIIITLRNPVDRLISFFRSKQAQLELPKEMNVDEYVSNCLAMPFAERKKQSNNVYWGVDGCHYNNYLHEWFSVFGKERIKIIFFDEIMNEPIKIMTDLCLWLGLDSSIYQTLNLQVENKTVLYKTPWLHRLAIKFNRYFEFALRRLPVLKQSVRKLYYYFNGDGQNNIDKQQKTSIQKLFIKDNIALAKFLREQGYCDLPDWLSENS